MNKFLFFRYRTWMLDFFSCLVKEYKYWKQSTNTANIVPLSANQIADIFYVSDKPQFFFGKKKTTEFHEYCTLWQTKQQNICWISRQEQIEIYWFIEYWTILTDASIFAKYYTTIILYYIHHNFIIYFFNETNINFHKKKINKAILS